MLILDAIEENDDFLTPIPPTNPQYGSVDITVEFTGPNSPRETAQFYLYPDSMEDKVTPGEIREELARQWEEYCEDNGIGPYTVNDVRVDEIQKRRNR